MMRGLPRRVLQSWPGFSIPPGWRRFTTAAERVEVRCGSSGSIHLQLHNLSSHAPSAPLMVYIPPFATSRGAADVEIPEFLQGHPTAVINYRWAGSSPIGLSLSPPPAGIQEQDFDTPLNWPTPIHDTLFGYSWLVENLAPPGTGRRDVYVYGSRLGAGLAASLALTETHGHQRMAVRGFAAFNGIYNWTMFLPDHRINRPTRTKSGRLRPVEELAGGSPLHLLKQQLPHLFGPPANLFDPFASPCLFFQTAGLLVPKSFAHSSAISSMLDSLSSATPETDPVLFPEPKPPRRSCLVFPPRKSTLRIPNSLLLFSTPPAPPGRKVTPRAKPKGNSFRMQADELAGLMRRSVDMLEVKERKQWDIDFRDWEGEAARRVVVGDVGVGNGNTGLTPLGEQLAREWLLKRLAA